MAHFDKGPDYRTPFGKNEFLRSTQDVKTESYTLAASTVPAVTIDGTSQKVIQPGTLMAKITSGAEAGKIGPYQADATDGRQTIANVVGLEVTFLPWQLLHRDVDVAVTYECTAVQARCFEYTNATTKVALTDATVNTLLGVTTNTSDAGVVADPGTRNNRVVSITFV